MTLKHDYQTPEPVNTQERYLHATVMRLDALCDMVSSLVEYIAEKEKITTVKNEVVEAKPVPKRNTRKKKE